MLALILRALALPYLSPDNCVSINRMQHILTKVTSVYAPLDKADGAAADTGWPGKPVDTRPGSILVPG